jgi:hypothetical protein
MTDARTLNWRFLVPDEPVGMLVLPVGDEPGDRTPPALGTVPAVVALDLAAATGHPTRRQCRQLLTKLSTAVAPGGWLCVGFANAYYPRAPWRRGALTLTGASRTMRRAGLGPATVYAALPDHRHPALLVPLTGPDELRFALENLIATYEPAGPALPRLRRRLLQAQRRAALAAPPALRAATVPAYCLLSRRPA